LSVRLPADYRLEPGIDYAQEFEILDWFSSGTNQGRRELFAAQDDRGRIIAEGAATRELLHVGQHGVG